MPALAAASKSEARPSAIPFNRASPLGRELELISQVVCSGNLCGDHHFTRQCHAALEAALGVPKVLLTTSCTHALEMAALLLTIEAGDEVIVPSFTFVSVANAFALRGARVIFADIRRDTLNLDETKLAALITPRTKAVIVVHYAGVGCEMDAILEIANRHGVRIVEDNAHGLFGKYKGRWLGTFGALATQSFHETKNLTCGEGGALLINDQEYIERAEIIREKGTNRGRFFRGLVDKYTWVDLGSSYLLGEMLAAYLYGQIEIAAAIQATRKRVWETYHRRLQSWTSRSGVALPTVPPHCDQAFHMFYMLLPSLSARQALIKHLSAHDILAVFHYVPLHLSEYASRWGCKPGDCPVTEEVSDRLVRLPFYNTLDEATQDRVIEAVEAFVP